MNFKHYLFQKDLLKITITVNISSLPKSIQNVVNNLLKVFKELQSLDGPIAPNPGPMFPIDEADIDKEDIISNPFIEIINEHRANINI